MDKALREQTELRLLVTAAFTDDPSIREKILDFPFTTKQACSIQSKFIGGFLRDPNADYSVLISLLTRDEQIAMITMMDNAISKEVEESRVEGTLDNLRREAADEKMRAKLSELMISESFHPDELRSIADEAELNTSISDKTDSKSRYLDEYHIPIDVIPTGFPLLDRLCGGGLALGTVSALGARPSVGKTTMAVNIASYNNTRRVLFFSLEMSARMVYDKLVSDKANIDYSDCVKHRVNLETVKAALAEYELMTVYDDVYRIEDIASIIRREKPAFVIIDYIQIVRTRREIDVPRQRIDYIAGVIKQTAKQTGAHIMCLSQITRGAKEEPTMSALKESGGLEETGDYVFLLKRPYVLDKSDERLKPEDTQLKIDKNKFGEAGLLEYYFDGAHQRFSEVGFMSDKKYGHEKKTQIARMKKEEADEQSGFDEDLPF